MSMNDFDKRAEEYLKNGDLQGLIELFTQAIESEPENYSYYVNRAGLYSQTPDFTDFIKAFEDIAMAEKLKPDAPAVYSTKGIIYKNLGAHKEAVQAYSRSLKLSKSDDIIKAVTFSNRGNCYHYLKKYSKAIKDYTSALEIERTAELYCFRGESYLEQKKYKAALKDFHVSIQLSAQYARAYIGRGNAYSFNRHYKRHLNKALRDYTTAIELEPFNMYAHVERARVYYALERYKEAIKDYSVILEEEPHNGEVYFCRGWAYYEIKHMGYAESDWKKALNRGYVKANEPLEAYFPGC